MPTGANYFTQYKQWIQFEYQGRKVGSFFERFSGGQVEYTVASGSPANSGGSVFRATRFRIGEISIEGYLERGTYTAILDIVNKYHKDRKLNDDFSVARILRSGESENGSNIGKLKDLFNYCTIIAPPQPEDGDVSREGDFIFFSMRLQPEVKTTFIDDNEVQKWDARAALDDKSIYTNP